jgi:hypothetical protein
MGDLDTIFQVKIDLRLFFWPRITTAFRVGKYLEAASSHRMGTAFVPTRYAQNRAYEFHHNTVQNNMKVSS